MVQRRSPTWTSRAAAMGSVALLTVGAAWSGRAAPPPANKTVQALIAAAQKQVDSGNLERGADLFVEIWRLDRTAHAALYNAARLYQLVGNLEKSETLWRDLLGEPGVPADAREKAQAKLAEVQQRRMERRTEDAARAEGNGQYGVAADLWSEAVAADGTRSDWLRRWGRALHLAGRHAQARSVYERYLGHPAGASAERAQVEAWRAELVGPAERPPVIEAPVAPAAAVAPADREAHRAPPVTAAAQHPTVAPTVRAAPEPPPGSAVPPRGEATAETTAPKVLTTLSLGVALAGGVVLWLAEQERTRLNEDTWGAVASGRSIDMTHADAQARANAIAQRRSIGVGVAGGGGALALVGAIWWGVRAAAREPVQLTAGIDAFGPRLAAKVAF